MTVKKTFACLGLLTGLFLFFAHGTAPAQGKEQDKKEVLTRVPEIRRIATYRDHGGEKLLRGPLSIARDAKDGNIFITSFEAGEVVILDSRGALIRRLGAGVGLFAPYGVAIDSAGLIYVSEMQKGLLKIFSSSGLSVDEIDLSRVMGRTVSPGRITLGKDGSLNIVDLAGNEILVLNSKREFARTLGKFDNLQKAMSSGNGRILGLSAMGKAVKVFGNEGALLVSFGAHGEEFEKSFSFPTGFDIDSKGRLWIADAFQHRLKVFSQDGEFLFNFGRMEEEKGGFFFPVDLCFGQKGELFVLEKGGERVQVFEVKDLKE
jgi:DNA-binding beta-propeller fold protein YncE